jgi:hypothetical protein
MQTRDPMRENARLGAANREAAYRTKPQPTAAHQRHVARARVRLPASPARATETLVEGSGPLQKPIVR